MFPRRVLLTTLAMFLGVSGPAAFAKGGNKPAGKVEGVLTAVTASPASVTINGVTLNVLPSTKIEINDLHAGLADLTVNAPAEAEYDPATKNAFKVEQADGTVAEPEDVLVSGKITAADPGTGAVSLDADADGTTDVTFVTDAQTEVEIGSAHVAPAQLGLLVGLAASVEYITDTLYAKEIKAIPATTSSLTGKVQAVNASAGTLQVQTKSGVRTVMVPAGADIRSRGRSVSLASVAAGANAQAKVTRNGAGTDILLKLTVSGTRAAGASIQRRGRGADDGAGHVRRGRGSDDATVQRRGRGADDGAGHIRRGRGSDDATVQRRGRGADDGPGHVRHGRGADDGVHHHRQRGRNS